jgi:selenocysteine-specific elongation factor
LLEEDSLPGGAGGFAEIEFDRPVSLGQGDRFILRRPSPPETIGGGQVIASGVKERARRHDARLLAGLAAVTSGRLEERLLGWMSGRILTHLADWADAPVEGEKLNPLVDHLLAEGRMVRLPGEIYLTRADADDFARRICTAVEKYHRRFPLRRGMWEAELRHSLDLERKPMGALLAWLAAEGRLALSAEYVRLPGFQVVYTRSQRTAIDQLLEKFSASPFHPPMYQEAVRAVGGEIVQSLMEAGTLVFISQTVLMRTEDWEVVHQMILTKIMENGQIKLGQVRDELGTSRKYAQAMLECLDLEGEIMRVGDYYQLKSNTATGSNM